MDYSLLGKRIRDERLLLRLTIEQLAERIDKSGNFIGQIERSESKPSIETLVDIANALGTTVDSLLSDNLKAHEDSTVKEINTLLFSMADIDKLFILDIIKRHNYHYKNIKQ